LSLPQDLGKFDGLAAIIARLRGPDGCPWDREQTHQSLRINLLSECYEVLEAIDRSDPEELCEELGDLLLQIVLHAQIAADTGEFDIGDVIKGISSKIVRRHPHVFGGSRAATAAEVMQNWEALKREERGEGTSMLEGVPKHMPALAYAYEVSRRAVRVGFEWKDLGGVIDKLLEEAREFKEASNREEKARELGDLLFTLVNFARWQGIDPEAALREANDKFYRRFTRMEALCRERGLELGKLSFEEMDALWEEAKKEAQG
jgi:tetrapyrrole methylase family protein/MazG family protein